MRENRPSGSEGGGVEANRLSLPLSLAALALGAAGRPRRNTPATEPVKKSLLPAFGRVTKPQP